MKKVYKLLSCLLCAVMLLTAAGCSDRNHAAESTTTEPVSKPEDNPVLAGSVAWCRGSLPFDELIGYGGEWSLLVMDEQESVDFSRYVILVLFYDDHAGSEYELTELAMVDGMATIGIHEKTPGEAGTEELVGCIVQLDEQPLEINSYRDEEAVG